MLNIRFLLVAGLLVTFYPHEPALAWSTWNAVKKDFRKLKRNISQELNSSSSSSKRATGSTSNDGERISAAMKYETQFLLELLGYDVGKADGIIGARTRNAIIAFQQDRQLAATGKVSSELVGLLRNELQHRNESPAFQTAPAAPAPINPVASDPGFDIYAVRIDNFHLGMSTDDFLGKVPGAKILDNDDAGLLSVIHKSNHYSMLFYFDRIDKRLYRIEGLESSEVKPAEQRKHLYEQYGQPSNISMTDTHLDACWGDCAADGKMRPAPGIKALQISISPGKVSYSLIDAGFLARQKVYPAEQAPTTPTTAAATLQASDFARSLEFAGYRLGAPLKPSDNPDDDPTAQAPFRHVQTLMEDANPVTYRVHAHPATGLIFLIEREIELSGHIEPSIIREKLIKKYGQPNGFGQGKAHLCWGECDIRIKQQPNPLSVLGSGSKLEIQIKNRSILYWMADGDVFSQGEARREALEREEKKADRAKAIPDSIL